MYAVRNYYEFNALCRQEPKMTKRRLEILMAASIGYMAGLRTAGMKTGDPALNDASSCNMEIQRYAREALAMKLPGWETYEAKT